MPITESQQAAEHRAVSGMIGPTPLFGFLNINKPEGWTSHDVVARVRVLLRSGRRARPKVGHLGTLDPAATGVLPLCVGKATKIAQYLVNEEKSYGAVMKLGERTDTQDATGTVVSTVACKEVDQDQLEEACRDFRGTIQQVPPMYSAVKVAGRPLYAAARAGLIVDRKPRTVVISSLRVLQVDGAFVTIDVTCSKGTYIRTLCADIGDRLGVGAHLFRLERHRVGPFTREASVTLEQVESAVRAGVVAELLMSADDVLGHLPEVIVDEVTAGRVCCGVPLPGTALEGIGTWHTGQPVRIKSDRRGLIAMGRVQPAGRRESRRTQTRSPQRLNDQGRFPTASSAGWVDNTNPAMVIRVESVVVEN